MGIFHCRRSASDSLPVKLTNYTKLSRPEVIATTLQAENPLRNNEKTTESNKINLECSAIWLGSLQGMRPRRHKNKWLIEKRAIAIESTRT